tara:strand:- start:12738 stop:12887 length:150 start_codon:yes stop_codon:yes gene_type:complete
MKQIKTCKNVKIIENYGRVEKTYRKNIQRKEKSVKSLKKVQTSVQGINE